MSSQSLSAKSIFINTFFSLAPPPPPPPQVKQSLSKYFRSPDLVAGFLFFFQSASLTLQLVISLYCLAHIPSSPLHNKSSQYENLRSSSSG